jgi:hypothetical protein
VENLSADVEKPPVAGRLKQDCPVYPQISPSYSQPIATACWRDGIQRTIGEAIAFDPTPPMP